MGYPPLLQDLCSTGKNTLWVVDELNSHSMVCAPVSTHVKWLFLTEKLNFTKQNSVFHICENIGEKGILDFFALTYLVTIT